MRGRKRESTALAGSARARWNIPQRQRELPDHWLVAAILLVPIIAPNAWAQAASDAEAEATVLEEVIVTARKREESLQNTPISITAFSASTLEEANMVDLRDIGKYTPGMSFTSYGMGSSEAGAIFLRGIGQSDHMVTTDPGVAFTWTASMSGATRARRWISLTLSGSRCCADPRARCSARIPSAGPST